MLRPTYLARANLPSDPNSYEAQLQRVPVVHGTTGYSAGVSSAFSAATHLLPLASPWGTRFQFKSCQPLRGPSSVRSYQVQQQSVARAQDNLRCGGGRLARLADDLTLADDLNGDLAAALRVLRSPGRLLVRGLVPEV